MRHDVQTTVCDPVNGAAHALIGSRGASRARALVAALVLVACVGASAPPAACGSGADGPAPPLPQDIDAVVARAMSAFQVPGLALAVVKDGGVVAAKGYGVRRLGETAAVDAHTRFGIASNTKVFTAVALGLLADEGLIQWEAPVVRYLPAFQMWDPYVTRELTVRDLLVHRSGLGLGAGDLLWWPSTTYSRPEIVRRLRYLRPATSFRGTYAYDNVLYIVAGELIEAVSGKSWEAFVEERILRPVGMRDSTTRHSDAARDGNVAATHAIVDGTVRPVKPMIGDATNAAGGINASAADMAAWLQVLLAGGKLSDGTRLYSEATANELTSVVTPLRVGNPPPELAALRPNQRGYALGLNVQDYRGRKLITHTGGLPGYVSRVAWLPDQQIGVAVLTNQESDGAFDAILYSVLDGYLGTPRTDWVEAFSAVRARSEAQAGRDQASAAAARNAHSTPSLPLAAYAGTYSDAWYGDITLRLEDGRLVMRFAPSPALVGDLEHWQYDTFVVRWRDRELRADAFVSFSLNPEGGIEQAKMRAVSPETDFSYDFHDLLLLPAAKK